MDLKELKKLAETLDDNSKRELIHFLQSRTKGMSAQVRAIVEIQEQKHKDGFVCPHCENFCRAIWEIHCKNTCWRGQTAAVSL